MCSDKKVDALILVHTAENVVKGLVELIEQNHIAKLVMGATSDHGYIKNMNIPTSQTACSVSILAEQSCDIWFVCKGNLVSRRERPLSMLKFQSQPSLLNLAESSSENNYKHKDKADHPFMDYDNSIFCTSSSKQLVCGSDTEQSDKHKEALAEVKNLKEKLRIESQKYQNLEKVTNEAIVKAEEFEKKYAAAAKDLVKYQKQKSTSLSNISVQQNFIEFSSAEIKQATNNNTNKIGEGSFGSVYKGLIRNTMVAVKILNRQSLQGVKEFHHEVAILGKVRHPNIVTLMGACSAECTVVYEFLPNGNLAQCLKCKQRPLSWQDRIRIADNICSALTFLHSFKPHPIVHGDLKPENILLDANLVSKLGDFGLCRLLEQSSAAGTTVFHESSKLYGTRPYMDPKLFQTGVLTEQCDVYSFGVVILQLVTGKGPIGIIGIAKDAAKSNQIHSIIDTDAGDWPNQRASKLVVLGLKCCNLNDKKRPVLEEVGKVIKDVCV